jgi:hypothetical protein
MSSNSQINFPSSVEEGKKNTPGIELKAAKMPPETAINTAPDKLDRWTE